MGSVGPVGPVDPVGPVRPVGPVGPVGPLCRVRAASERRLLRNVGAREVQCVMLPSRLRLSERMQLVTHWRCTCATCYCPYTVADSQAAFNEGFRAGSDQSDFMMFEQSILDLGSGCSF